MKAIVLSAYGAVDQLGLREVPDPTVGPGEIKVRMAGASINPVDWKLRSGALRALMPLELPAILGRDCSGEVVELGAGVTTFRIGQRVAGLVNRGYAELVVAPAGAWAEVPPTLDLVDAGALPLVLLTGAQLVEEALRPHKGDCILVTGAVGSVGRAAVFAAKTLGAIVWAGVRDTQKSGAHDTRADFVVGLDDADDIDRLPLLDGIADTVGGETLVRILGRLKPGGTIASVVGEPAGATARGFVVRGALTHPDSRRLTELLRAVADGRLAIPIACKVPLAGARQAQTRAEAGAGGKVLLTR